MNLVDQALRAGGPPAAADAPRRSLVVAGGGGTLGSALVEQLLGGRAFAPLRLLVTRDFHASIAGLEPVVVDGFAAARAAAPLADLAIVVFDRERHANGRDAALLRPRPEQLPALAAWLRRQGVRDLLVVLPHAAASLPQALQAGLANLDEQAVAALGFEHLLILRSAQHPAEAASRGMQRVADLVLAQLRVMTPQNLQPVRALKVAQLAVALAQRLEASPPGTRVMPPEVVWQAAQLAAPDELAQAWLDGRTLPRVDVKVPRM